ncbi:hypothetical protein C8J56DRAFT_322012 [Mycena floridula]|nr:hypothetical protein C8J56DRAFT_322012 [Mycena floridula]
MAEQSHSPLVILYITIYSVGGLGLLLLLATYFFSTKLMFRHPTLVNFWLTWVIYSISYSLLVYSGTEYNPSRESWYPPPLLCRVQSAMIHGAPPMSAVSGMIVVLQTWLAIHSSFKNGSKQSFHVKKWPSGLRMASVLVLPYLVFLVFAVASAIVGNQSLDNMNGSNGIYCTLNQSGFDQYAVPIFCTVMLLVLISIEVVVSIRYYICWRNTSKLFPLVCRRVSPSLVMRILLFNLYSIATLGTTIIFLATKGSIHNWFPYLVQAALPLVAFLVFGTQKDFFIAWNLCAPPKPDDLPSLYPALTVTTGFSDFNRGVWENSLAGTGRVQVPKE